MRCLSFKQDGTLDFQTQNRIGSDLMNKMIAKIESQEYPNIHSVLLAHKGELIFEHYFQGSDQRFGKEIGIVEHSANSLHDLRSISKSIISTCVGIAIDEGLILSVHQRIADFFPELKVLFEGDKSNWTVQNFLTMTTGLDWNENVPYDNPANDEVQMTYNENPVKFVLGKPLKSKPGKTFNYNGGATQVLAEIITRSSKMPLDVFVKHHLFDPLGIENFEWCKYSIWNGVDQFAAASGLRMTSRDLMKIGFLYRNLGAWNERQIISANWALESFEQKIEFPSAVTQGSDSYGYQFWMWPELIQDIPFKMIAARGNGGQNIYWDFKNDVIVVTTAGNYNNWEIKNDPYALLRNEIYPLILNDKS